MTDSATHHAATPTANGFPHKLHKRPPKKTKTPETSPKLPDRQAGRLQELHRDSRPVPNVSDQLQPAVNDGERKHGHLTSIKQRFSNRQSSGGFLIEKEKPRSRRQSQESSASSSKAQEKWHPGGSRKRPDSYHHDQATQSNEHGQRSESVQPGSFMSRDIITGERFPGRRSINFDERLPSPTEKSTASTDHRSKPSIRSSPFHTPARAAMATAPRASSESPAIDSAQIVRMALNLSEGRKMHLDPGHVPSIPTSVDRRTVSASVPAKTKHPSLSQAKRSSERARDSKTFSSGRNTPSAAPSGMLSLSSNSSAANSSSLMVDRQPEYAFSPATLARAERAKAFFELANQHRRLMQYLPPLHHNVHRQEGNAIPMGRDFNPVQYIRNREARISSRRSIDAEKEGWMDQSLVKTWVDAVEREANQEGYIEGDIVHLPRWVAGTGMSTNPHSEASRPSQAGTQKTFEYSHSIWGTEPPELLADAYWLEQDDHKKLIRNRSGTFIFKEYSKPARRRAGTNLSTKTFETRYTASSDEEPQMQSSRRGTDISRATIGEELDADQMAHDIQFSPKHKSKAAAVRRRFLRRKKHTLHNEQSSSDNESDRSVEGFPSRRGPKNTNIGPLERHMKDILEKEQAGESSVVDSPETQHDSPQSPEGHRRGGFSEGSPKLERHHGPGHHRQHTNASITPFPDLHQRGQSAEQPGISIDHADDVSHNGSKPPLANGRPKQSIVKHPELGEPLEVERISGRPSRLSFLRRSKHPKQAIPNTAQTDFADAHRNDQGRTARRHSIHSKSDSDSNYQDATPDVASTNFASSESLAQNAKRGGTSPTTRHFFKTGRIGQIMRSEKAEPHLLEPPSSPPSRGYVSSDAEDTRSRGGRSSRRHAGSFKSSNGQPSLRSLSISSRHPRYHIQNLPSFVSSGTSPEKERNSFLSPYGDHISRQNRQRREQSRQSRFSDLAPPSIETSDVSPNSSYPDLSRVGTRTSTNRDDTISRGRRSGYESGSGSETVASRAQSAATRLNNALGAPGDLCKGPGTLPTTGLTSLDPRRDPNRRGRQDDREKSRQVPVAVQKPKKAGVSRRDIARVQTLLLATGIKASNIVERANTPRDRLPEHIVKAVQTVGKDPASMGTLTRRQEHVVAAQLLSSHLQSSMQSFDSSAVDFRDKTCQGLTRRIDDLRDLVANHLTHQVHEEGDRADGFVAQLTTTHTLDIKQVNDSVDMMLRKRRQRLRWMRKAGFSILEWVLVALMWWIWVVVFAISTTKRVIGSFVGMVRWSLFID
ncbi:MAG: hypothetical protein Q9159_007531 [Coniocarpon cinnabarinum]